jgi:ubiquitin C-terminal hydrolase
MIVERSLSLAGIVHGNLMHKPTGITNRGNTCYMNALMQCLRSCSVFVKGLMANGCTHERAVVFGLMGDTDPLIRLSATMYGMPYLMQHDSSELLLKILDGLRGDLSMLFESKYTKTLLCPQCSVQKHWSEVCTILTVKPGGTVQKSISDLDFVIVSGEERCDTCKVHLTSLGIVMVRHPEIVVVQVHGSSMTSRANVCIDLDRHINFQSETYTLKSVLDHHGCGISSGHYTARVLRGDTWWKANDSSCTECMDPSSKTSQTVSLALYERGA